LSDVYKDLKDLFVEHLKVPQPDFKLIYKELERLGQLSSSPSLNQVKENIWALNSFLEISEGVPEKKPLGEFRILPVRYPKGEVKLCTAETQFAIVDRVPLGEIFAHQIKILDFTFDEVRELDPFIRWMRIEMRFLSRQVEEISSVQGEKVPTRTHTESIRSKAHAFYR
jgi:hypothetical protein